MMPEPKPTAPFVLRAMHCHADAGVESVTATVNPTRADAKNNLMICPLPDFDDASSTNL
jgi:hypothetical protein